MRQFDVFICENKFDGSKETEPPFTDPELGWFFTDDCNKLLDEIEGEWVVFARESFIIDREFLNSLAIVISEFPMVDAFAPRIRTNDGKFLGGSLLRKFSKGGGFASIEENAPLCFVAAPFPQLAVFSRRIIQRTGKFDKDLPANARLIDYTLRMMHAGGKMFSAPYLVANCSQSFDDLQSQIPDAKAVSQALFKSLGFAATLPFAIRHPSIIKTLFKNRKILEEKREAAILLSKFKSQFRHEITAK